MLRRYADAMIAGVKTWIAARWPVLRLRTILLGTLLFVAALPGFGAIFLRVYENALVRGTEAELVAQGAALAASAAIVGTGAQAQRGGTNPAIRYDDRMTEVDLRASPILPPTPSAKMTRRRPDGVAIDLARRMMPAFEETRLTTLTSILMLDRQAVVLNGGERGRSLAGLPEVKAALAGNAVTILRRNGERHNGYPPAWLSRAANIRLHHARPVRIGGDVVAILLLSRPPRALFLGLYEDRGKIILGIALIFLVLLFLSAILSRSIVRPIEGLSRATRSLASGRRIAPHHPSLQVVEIRTLFEDFEQMADSIEKRSRYLRDFASSLSHEFKTPLTAISGAIELLQDHGADMRPVDRQRFLANMAADADRLSRLVRRLMELARADVLVGKGDARTPLGPLLAAVADAAGSGNFNVISDLPQAHRELAIDPGALEAVVTILADNARQAGATKLVIRSVVRDGVACLDLVDDGPGIPEGDQDRAFDPFFTSKREQGGTGLGLAIARSLLEAYRGDLRLVPSTAGAHFRISCPVAPIVEG